MGSSVSSDARTVGIPQNGFVLLLLAGTLWGTGGPVAQVLQLDLGVGPMAVGTYRLLIAGAVITAFLLVSGRLRRLRPSAPLVRRLALNAVLHAIFQVLFFASLAFIPAGLSALVKIGSVPVFITIGVCLLSRRMPTVGLLVPVVLAVLGLGLLAGFPSTDAPPLQVATGLACALGAGLTFSIMGLANRTQVEGLDPLVNSGLGMLGGAVLLLPFGLFMGLAVPATGEVFGLLAFLGLVPTVLAYLAYFAGLRSASDTGVAVGTIAEPLTATLLSVAFLDERMTPLGVLGAVLLVVSMAGEPVARRLESRKYARGGGKPERTTM